MKTWQKLSLTAGAITLVGGMAFTSATVWAQTATPTPDTATPEAIDAPPQRERGGGLFGWADRFFGHDGPGRHGRGMRGEAGGPMGRGGMMMGRGGMGGAFGGVLRDEGQALLAEALGIDEAELTSALDAGQTILEIAEAQGMDETELQAAFQTALEARLEEAVSADELTQDQADALLERLSDGLPFLNGGPFGGGPMGGGLGMQTIPQIAALNDQNEIMADALELSEAAYEAALDEGQTLSEIAEAQGLDEEALRAGYIAAIESRLDAAVEKEQITQDQADALLERLEAGGNLGGRGWFGFGGR